MFCRVTTASHFPSGEKASPWTQPVAVSVVVTDALATSTMKTSLGPVTSPAGFQPQVPAAR